MFTYVRFRSNIDYHFYEQDAQIRAFTYRNYAVVPHAHEFYEVNIILSGHGVHQIEEKTVEVHAGNVFVIPPDIIHTYRDTHQLDVFHILLRPEFLQRNYAEAASVDGYLLLTEIEPFLRQNASDPHFLQLSQQQLLQIKPDLELLAQNTPPEKTAPIAVHTMWKLLYLFSGYLKEQVHTQAPASYKYEWEVLQMLEYIHQHYHEKITIERLCGESFLSRSTCLRSFQAICGCTPLQYIQNYRRKKATELLQNGEQSKSGIAQACGYYDQSHMKRALRPFIENKNKP